jgi:hypothetical protein
MNDSVTYKINLKKAKDQYYIDRSGRIHKYDGDLHGEIHSMHYEIAKKLYPNHDRPQDVLNKLGWVIIGSTVYNNPIIYIKPSQAQINKLDRLGYLNQLLILNDTVFINYINKYL